MTGSTRRALTFGALGGCVGLGFGVYVSRIAEGDGFRWFIGAATIAAFLCCAALWRLLAERSERHRPAWGAAAGALAGVVSHYFTWYFQYLSANVCYWLTGGCTSSLGEPPANLFMAVPGAAGFTFFSLLGFGWLTLLIGAGLGLGFGFASGKRSRPLHKRG